MLMDWLECLDTHLVSKNSPGLGVIEMMPERLYGHRQSQSLILSTREPDRIFRLIYTSDVCTNMNTSQRQLNLTILFLGCLAMISCGPHRLFCSDRVFVSLDKFDSLESGARAAVRRLSEEIHRCPQAKEYDISWNYVSDPQDRGWRGLKYYRQDDASGLVGYEYDPGSGTGGTYLVDDTAVDRVASEGGVLSDFAKYEKPKKDHGQSTPEGRGEEKFKFQVPSPQR
ncbi:MAG: hypothetical protein QOF62_953 [Pyrinomonadaceae bacterium]|jgi:hypothetical protein|nr:hypothetical protein [Pyrinomonadaceae bacterium]